MREKGAGLLILLLIALSVWNIFRAEKLIRDIDAKLSIVESSAESGDYESAEEAMSSALSLWLGSKGYTHIFIRHAEIDSCSDVFYEVIDAVTAREPESISVNLEKLRYHLGSISSMERISLGNIF